MNKSKLKTPNFDYVKSIDTGAELFKIIEVDGVNYALNPDEVEYYLTRFIKMKNQLKKEKSLRKRYDFVKMKYDEYQTALALCKDRDKL